MKIIVSCSPTYCKSRLLPLCLNCKLLKKKRLVLSLSMCVCKLFQTEECDIRTLTGDDWVCDGGFIVFLVLTKEIIQN